MDFLLAGWGQVFGAVPPEDGLVRITWSDIARRVPLVGHDEWAATVRRDERRQPATTTADFVATQDGVRHDLIVDGHVAGRRAARPPAARSARWSGCKAAVTIVADALGDARLGRSRPAHLR